MNTFLVYPDFKKSAECLDYKRLGKQRPEAWDIYRINLYILTGRDLFNSEKQKEYLLKRYSNHPALKMWRGYEQALLFYGRAICLEWIKRGYKDNMYLRFLAESYCRNEELIYPPWLGDKKFHSCYRASLLYKDYEYYKYLGWKEQAKLEYLWKI